MTDERPDPKRLAKGAEQTGTISPWQRRVSSRTQPREHVHSSSKPPIPPTHQPPLASPRHEAPAQPSSFLLPRQYPPSPPSQTPQPISAPVDPALPIVLGSYVSQPPPSIFPTSPIQHPPTYLPVPRYSMEELAPPRLQFHPRVEHSDRVGIHVISGQASLQTPQRYSEMIPQLRHPSEHQRHHFFQQRRQRLQQQEQQLEAAKLELEAEELLSFQEQHNAPYVAVPQTIVFLPGSPSVYSQFLTQYDQDHSRLAHSITVDSGSSCESIESSARFEVTGRSVPEDHSAAPLPAGASALHSRLRTDAVEFKPRLHQPQHSQPQSRDDPHPRPQRAFGYSQPHQQYVPSYTKAEGADMNIASGAGGAEERREAPSGNIKERAWRLLREYALKVLAPSSDPMDSEAAQLAHVKRTVVRVPPVIFNEQKLERIHDCQILFMPQSPAMRGQEALSRVSLALEHCLRLRNVGAAMLTDYKFKENYLKNAPPEVLDIVPRAEDEGTHDILIAGLECGIVCIQVTCVEAGTNNSTVKRQVRETVRQLQKDVKVVRHLFSDLDLDDGCITTLLALPNITRQQLKHKLEAKVIKSIASMLNTTEDLEGLLTLDCLPSVGHRHWSTRQSRDTMREWFTSLTKRGKPLSEEKYMQIFARYTSGWSAVEVWGPDKPRVQVRSLGHAVSETYRRYQRASFTPFQHALLVSRTAHVHVKASTPWAATVLLKAKVATELRRGVVVVVFLPGRPGSLRKEYESLAESERSSADVYFWSMEAEEGVGLSGGRLSSVDGESRKMKDLLGEKKDMVAVLDRCYLDDRFCPIVAELKSKVRSVWISTDTRGVFDIEMLQLESDFVLLQCLERVPTAIQSLISYALQEESSATSVLHPQHSSWMSALPQSRHVPHDVPDSAVSSYHGLPTDGPTPVFIWHPAEESSKTASAKKGILKCYICMSKLRKQLRELVENLDSDVSQISKSDQDVSSTKHADSQFSSSSTPLHKTHKATGEADEGRTEFIDETDKSWERCVDVNSGNVPPPLSVSDVVFFTDTREDRDVLLKVLDLVQLEKVVHTLSDLFHVVDAEKAVVGYIGTRNGKDVDFHTLLYPLIDIMALCQGQLILGFEFENNKKDDHSSRIIFGDKSIHPLEVDIETMLEQSHAEHNCS